MIVDEPKERQNHLSSDNHRNVLKWQERTKTAKIMRCSCGLFYITSYAEKHLNSADHITNISRRKAMNMDLTEEEIRAVA
jgi:hypothetical protein